MGAPLWNDEASWRELLMLPQSILDPPRRGGKQHAKAAAAYTLDRLKRWEDGERLLLWQTQQPQRGRRSPLSRPEKASRVRPVLPSCPLGWRQRTRRPLQLLEPFTLCTQALPEGCTPC